jgi:hypothetical protein
MKLIYGMKLKYRVIWKKQFGTFFNTPIEAVTFELERKKIFLIEQYSNSPHIRMILIELKDIEK